MSKSQFGFLLVVSIVVLMIIPFPAAADPPGIQADSGNVYPGSFFAFIQDGVDYSVWTTATVNQAQGDLYAHGHSIILSHILDYYLVIKIKPQDTSLTHVEIKVSSTFYYGISASFGEAIWSLQYVVMDMSGGRPLPIGWSQYGAQDFVQFGVKDYQSYSTPSSSWKLLYDTTRCVNLYVINPNGWTYVGVWLRCRLDGISDFYQTTACSGSAWYNPASISFRFY